MWRALLLTCVMTFGVVMQVSAQQAEIQPSQILVIDTDQLFNQSQFGQRVARELELEGGQLETEFRSIEKALEQEEKELTQLRATMNAEEFRILADAFDQKVQDTRAEQLSRTKAYNSQIDVDRVTFLNAAAPILQELMQEAGASVLLERRTVVLSMAVADITAAAVAQIDSVLGNGSQPATTGD
jgi:Skp family chaperone for outer membrane proteins